MSAPTSRPQSFTLQACLIGNVLAAFLLLGCAGAPEPANAPAGSVSPAPSASAVETSASPAPSAPELDLSTPEKARLTIYEVLKRNDKEAFKRCVTRRILERQKDHFDEWYGVWQASAAKGPQHFEKVGVSLEDGVYKLDEN